MQKPLIWDRLTEQYSINEADTPQICSAIAQIFWLFELSFRNYGQNTQKEQNLCHVDAVRMSELTKCDINEHTDELYNLHS